MLTLMTLLLFGLAASIAVGAMFVIAAIMKFTFHAVFWPLKLILLPFILVAVVIKIALVVTLFTVAAALILPLLIVGAVLAVPLIVLSVLT